MSILVSKQALAAVHNAMLETGLTNQVLDQQYDHIAGQGRVFWSGRLDAFLLDIQEMIDNGIDKDLATSQFECTCHSACVYYGFLNPHLVPDEQTIGGILGL